MNEHLNEAAVARIADGEDAAPEHVRTCARCANALIAASQLKHAVRKAVPCVQPPPSLAARIAGARSRRGSPWS